MGPLTALQYSAKAGAVMWSVVLWARPQWRTSTEHGTGMGNGWPSRIG